MKTYCLNKNKSLYIELYECLKEDILTKKIKPNEKLPSKRVLAKHQGISLNTVQNAYHLLLDEGYIVSLEKKGYYAHSQLLYQSKPLKVQNNISIQESKNFIYDFTTKNIDLSTFPLFTWNKVVRDTLQESQGLLEKPHYKGIYSLRKNICAHLEENKNIQTSPENIIIGCGIEYLLQLLLIILPKHQCCIENPGYHKIKQIFENNKKSITYCNLDDEGLSIAPLRSLQKQLVYLTPFNQFPTGIKMSIQRKTELLKWSEQTDSYLIEDDFDSDFRILGAPSTSLYSLNPEKVIFLSTFSRSIAPSLRLAYMIIPNSLLSIFEEKFRNYSNTVSTLDQLALSNFINQGYFTRHLNKIKTIYAKRRNYIIQKLAFYPELFEIDEYKNYLSLIVKIKKPFNQKTLEKTFLQKKIDIHFISNYYYTDIQESVLIIGYCAISTDLLEEGIETLLQCFL